MVDKNIALKAILSAGVSYLVDELMTKKDSDDGEDNEVGGTPDDAVELDEVIPFAPTTPHFDPSSVPTLGVDSKNRLHNLVYPTLGCLSVMGCLLMSFRARHVASSMHGLLTHARTMRQR